MLDVDKSGSISFDELCKFILEKDKMEKEDEDIPDNDSLRAMFSAFDVDGNGKLDKKEVTDALKTWGETVTTQELEDEWKQLDSDGDGFISFEEFKKLVIS